MSNRSTSSQSSVGSTPGTTSRQNSNTSHGGSSTTLSQPAPRKVPIIQSKNTLPSHSQFSVVKRAFTGVDEGTTYFRAMYHEKKAVESFEKFILAKQEATDAWNTHMENESNPAIRDLYRHVCELDRLWVQQQNKLRSEVKEARKLFKLLMLGEENLQQMQKTANAAANKVCKIQKQMDDALAKGRTSKGNLDLRKLEQIQRDLEKAVETDLQEQSTFQQQTKNNQIFKYNSIRKMLANLADAEKQLYKDCWRIMEVKAQAIRIHMGKAFSKVNSESIQNSNDETNLLINELYRDLCMTRPPDSDRDRPPQPTQPLPSQSFQSAPPTPQPRTNLPKRTSQPLPELPTGQGQSQGQGRQVRTVPSAPDMDAISTRGSVRSQGSSGTDSEFDACYNPIPDLEMNSDEEGVSSHREEDIYEFDDEEFDDVGDIYENCHEDEQLSSESLQRPYLEVVGEGSQRMAAAQPNHRTATRQQSQQHAPPLQDDDIYEETDLQSEPSFPPPALSGGTAQVNDEDIFGTISSVRQSTAASRPTQSQRPAAPLPQNVAASRSTQSSQNPSQSQSVSIWPSLEGIGESDTEPVESYSQVWNSSTGTAVNNGPARPSAVNSTGNSTGNSQQRSQAQNSAKEKSEPRYVSGPGTRSSGTPARPDSSTDPKGNLADEFREKLRLFEQKRQSQTDTPPPLPERKRLP